MFLFIPLEMSNSSKTNWLLTYEEIYDICGLHEVHPTEKNEKLRLFQIEDDREHRWVDRHYITICHLVRTPDFHCHIHALLGANKLTIFL